MLLIQITNRLERQQVEHAEGVLELGRGPKRENVARCVLQDLFVSKNHLRVQELPDGAMRVENLSTRNPVRVESDSLLAPGESRDIALPVRLTIGETVIDIEGCAAVGSKELFETIRQPMLALAQETRTLGQLGDTPSPETLAQWFETVIAVQQAAAGSPAFYDKTAEALVSLVGLDRALVLLRRGDDWEVVARAGRAGTGPREFSHTVLRRVLTEERTFFNQAARPFKAESLRAVEAVVASPIIDARNRIVGALYASRNRSTEGKGVRIGPLEAQVVQLLASAVSSGLARQEQEAEASRLRVQFEQFFSVKLAQELQRNPRLLEGQEREITVLFSDIRGFSRLAERLGPHESCRLVGDVMEHLTEQIRKFDGVVVDYMGDGLLAMWNAPADQPDHALLGCRAALAILADLPALSADWSNLLGAPLAVGIGLNTGPALVGNTGSRYKFKYGPLGHAVNLASRVEGATKQFGLPLLITGSTRARLGDGFVARRLARVRVVGIAGDVDLYELHGETAAPEWLERRDTYEQALAQFEAGQWPAACRTVYALLAGQEGHYDVACLDLAARALQCLKTPPESFDAVLELTSK